MRATCTIDDCSKLVHGHDLCSKHYALWRRNGDPIKRRRRHPCSVEDCGRWRHDRATGFCPNHLRAFRLYGDPLGSRRYVRAQGCSFPGCTGEHHAYALCKTHYHRGLRMRQMGGASEIENRRCADQLRDFLHRLEAEGWNHSQIARESGVSLRVVLCILAGQPAVNPSTADRILTAFGRHVDEFFEVAS